MTECRSTSAWRGEVCLASGDLRLDGTLEIPTQAGGLVLFAHGSRGSRHSERGLLVARALQGAGLATLRFDLLTKSEELIDAQTGHLRFHIALLASRLRLAAHWARQDERTATLPIGCYGAGTGAAAALTAATDREAGIGVVVSRGGRPDLAGEALGRVRVPTLLIVGGADEAIIPQNEAAYEKLLSLKRFAVVPGATHFFEEAGALDQVGKLAAHWFAEHLPLRCGHL